jgi:hypothetical protein
MYWVVPTIVPCSVRGFCWVGSDDSASAGAVSFPVHARPKSRSFAPDRVSMTLPGFRSRWTMPCRWAASSADAIWIP